MKNYIKEFNIDTSFLTKAELEILEKLVEAAKLIARIYGVQRTKDAFYPQSATRKEIEKAASENPEILSPYTVVEKDKSGRLIATPYHVKYREMLLPVAKKLNETAQIATLPQDFRNALQIQAKSLLSGDYSKAQIAWIKIKPYILDIVIGPIERLEDNMFFIKRSYQAWVGVMDKNVTDKTNGLKEIVFSTRRQLLPSEGVDFMDKTEFRADETVIFSGMIANYNYTTTTLPNDIELLEKYGSKAWIFLPQVRENFESCQQPLFNLIFAPFFKNSFSKAQLFRGYQLIVSMHEIARIIVRYRFATVRLKELYPIFNEAAIEALAIKMSGTLLLKDVISQKEMEAVLVMFITRMFDGYTEKLENKRGSKPLVSSNAIMLNSLIAKRSLQVTKDGISWPNFTKMFISVSELADELERILAEGTYVDAQNYLKKNSSLTVFQKFSKAIKTLHSC